MHIPLNVFDGLVWLVYIAVLQKDQQDPSRGTYKDTWRIMWNGAGWSADWLNFLVVILFIIMAMTLVIIILMQPVALATTVVKLFIGVYVIWCLPPSRKRWYYHFHFSLSAHHCSSTCLAVICHVFDIVVAGGSDVDETSILAVTGNAQVR